MSAEENKPDHLQKRPHGQEAASAIQVQDIYTLPVGEILRLTRIERGFSIDDVCRHLRIKKNYIEALEKGDFGRLPGQAYTIGFVKSYAGFLNLPVEKVVRILKSQAGGSVVRPKYTFPVATDDQKMPGVKTILGSLALIFILSLLWDSFSGKDYQTEIPAVPRDLKEQLTPPPRPASAAPAPYSNAAAPAAAPKALPASVHPVVLQAAGNVWLEIRNAKKKPVFSRVLKLGEEYWVPNDGTVYTMTTGNAGGLRLIVRGTSLPSLGRAGEVKRNISLNPDTLLPAGATPVSPQN